MVNFALLLLVCHLDVSTIAHSELLLLLARDAVVNSILFLANGDDFIFIFDHNLVVHVSSVRDHACSKLSCVFVCLRKCDSCQNIKSYYKVINLKSLK